MTWITAFQWWGKNFHWIIINIWGNSFTLCKALKAWPSFQWENVTKHYLNLLVECEGRSNTLSWAVWNASQCRATFNFTNILQTVFMRKDPKSAINIVKPSVLFALLGSAPIKALRKTLMKLTPATRILTVVLSKINAKEFKLKKR